MQPKTEAGSFPGICKGARALLLFLMLFSVAAVEAMAADGNKVLPTPEGAIDRPIEQGDKPLYSPFTARYLLDEVRLLRTQMERTRAELIERQVTKEYEVAREAAAYARNAVELFFFIIVGVTTLLVFLGWTSLRDVRSRVQQIAEDKVEALVAGYSDRLDDIELELKTKTQRLLEAQAEIDETNEVHSLWLRAAQENSVAAKIAIYDEILKVRPADVEALTFKADAALQLDEIEWAFSLANRALDIEPENPHALYQRSCANACRGNVAEAIDDLKMAIGISESHKELAASDPAFDALREQSAFREIFEGEGVAT